MCSFASCKKASLKMRIWTTTTIAIFLFCIVSCERDERSLASVNIISYGTSFGLCQGYCNRYMKVYPELATLKEFAWGESGEFPEKQCSLPLESYQFISIRDSVDVGNFFSMDEPEELTPIVTALRELMEEFEDCDQL
jgi:hypothetical protein